MLHFITLVLSRIFFREIKISGEPYVGKTALWIGNHSNGIVDPTVLLALAPVFLRPLAKATLWNNWVMKIFLNLMHAIPVARTQDAEEMTQRTGHQVGDVWIKEINARAFQVVHCALCEGKKILIFPEGLSHDDPYMHPLKNGVARMALNANHDVTIQPVILDYSEKNEFRSELYIHYCTPIKVVPNSMSVENLMNKVEQVFKEYFVQFECWDSKRNWYYLFKIYYGRIPHNFLEFRDFVNSNRERMNQDPILFSKVQTMRCMLQSNNIKPLDSCWRRAVQNGKQDYWFLMLILSIFSFVFIKGPILFLHMLVWGLPFEVCNRLGGGRKYNRDVYATMKIAHGMWFFPLWACFIPALITLLLYESHPKIHALVLWLITFVSMPLILLLGLYISESFKFCSGYFKYGVLKLTFPRALEEMLREWKNISAAVSQKVKQ